MNLLKLGRVEAGAWTRWICFLGALFFCGSLAFAQDSIPATGPGSPEQTEIILPEIILTFEEPEVQPVGGLLPDLEESSYHSLASELPQLGSLTVDSRLYSQLISASPGEGLTLTGAGLEGRQSIYTRGLIGMGLHQFLRGSVSIYQLGANPELRLEFNHQSSDGGFKGAEFVNAGEGLLWRQSSFSGAIGLDLGGPLLNLDLAYESEETGFQSLAPNYFGSNLQSFRVYPEFFLALDPQTSFSAGLGYAYDRRFYSSTVGETETHDRSLSKLAAEAALSLETEAIDFRVALSYQFGAFPGSTYQHLLNPLLGLDWRATSWLGLGAEIETLLDFSSNPKVPFRVYAQFDPVPQASILVDGGYRASSLDLASLWEDIPFLSSDLPAGDLIASSWFGGLSTSFWPLDLLEINLGVNFEMSESIALLESYSDGEEVFPWSLGQRSLLTPRARLTWRPISELIVSTGWIGGFLDDDPLAYDHEIDLRLEFRDRESRFGGILQAMLPIEGSVQIPELSLNAWLGLAEIVELELNVLDPLSLLIPEGRGLYGSLGGFHEQGFRAEILVGLSL